MRTLIIFIFILVLPAFIVGAFDYGFWVLIIWFVGFLIYTIPYYFKKRKETRQQRFYTEIMDFFNEKL